MLSGMAFYAADTHRATSQGAAHKGQLKEKCGLEPRTNFFFRLSNRQKLVRIRFENIRAIMCTLFSIGGARVEVDARQVGNPLSQ